MGKSKHTKHTKPGQQLTQEQKHHIKRKAADAKKDANAKLAVAAAAHAVAPEPSVDNIAVAHDPAGAPEPIAEPIVDVHVNATIDALPRKKRRQLFKTRSLKINNVSSHMFNRNTNIARAARDANDARAARAAQYKWTPNNNNNNNTDNIWNPFTDTMFNNVSNSAEPNVVTEAEADVETKSVIVPVNKANTIEQYKTYLSKVGPKSRTLGPRETILFENDNIDEGLLSVEDKNMREQLRTARLPNNNINKIRKNAVRLRGLERIEYENQKRSPITRRLLSLVGKSKNKTTKRFLNEEMRQAAYNSNNSLKQAMLAKNPNFVYQPNRMSNRLTKRAINNAEKEETRRIYEEQQQKIDMKRAEIAERHKKRDDKLKLEEKLSITYGKEKLANITKSLQNIEEYKKAAKAEEKIYIKAAKAAEAERMKAAKAAEAERMKAAKAAEIERIKATKAAETKAEAERMKAAKAAETQYITADKTAFKEKYNKKALNINRQLNYSTEYLRNRKGTEDKLRREEQSALAAALAEKEKIAPGRWTRFKTGLKKIFTKKNNYKK